MKLEALITQSGVVYVAPEHIVSVQEGHGENRDTLVTLSNGDKHIVLGPAMSWMGIER